MVVKNGGNQLILTCKSISSKCSRAKNSQFKGHYFAEVYSSPVLMTLMQENASYCHVYSSNLKMRLFSYVSIIFTGIQNELLATNSKNAILSNVLEYYEIFQEAV